MSRTILIVDDSPTLLQMLTDTLHGAGHEVMQAVNGEDALRQVSGRSVGLIITDFNMPVMNGVALIGRLRASMVHKFTPILVLTTEYASDRKNECRMVGATGWSLKPFDPDRLVQVVNRLVR